MEVSSRQRTVPWDETRAVCPKLANISTAKYTSTEDWHRMSSTVRLGWGDEVAQYIKVLATRAHDPSSIPGTSIVGDDSHKSSSGLYH